MNFFNTLFFFFSFTKIVSFLFLKVSFFVILKFKFFVINVSFTDSNLICNSTYLIVENFAIILMVASVIETAPHDLIPNTTGL